MNIVKLLNSERQILEGITRQKTSKKRLVDRSQIILKCAEGKTNREVAALLNLSMTTVGTWRKRFKEQGMACLIVKKNIGKLKDTYAQILKKLKEPPPQGEARWNGKTLAEALDVSKDIIWKILRNKGVSLDQTRTRFVRTNKEFMAKSINIIGLYLSPPENALVICVDKNPRAQVFEGQIGYVEISNQKVREGLRNNYKKYGTLSLLTALHTVKGQIESKLAQEKKHISFQIFLDKILEGIRPDQEVHIILEEYGTHNKENAWSVRYPHVFFYFTQTSSHWLGQVEILFSILTRKHLRNGDFNSIEALRIAIQGFINMYHTNSHPFVWKKKEA